ncbi:MAG TPA: hypothetical protein EYP19_14860 [Desulfobacterales bacterium]|nr:hypothetical protein [Desulfobacterales bacterium]
MKKIVAFARVEVVVEEEIEILWGKYGPKGGIKKSVFESYFKGKRRGAAIVFSEIQQLLPAIDPYELVSNFVPPQNYRYLSEEESRVLVQGAPTIDRWEL